MSGDNVTKEIIQPKPKPTKFKIHPEGGPQAEATKPDRVSPKSPQRTLEIKLGYGTKAWDADVVIAHDDTKRTQPGQAQPGSKR